MKKLLTVIICCIITVSLAGISFAEENEITREDVVKQAQGELTTLGFYKGDASGKMNKETRDAIREFQKQEMDMKLPNGLLNQKTRDMISEKAAKKSEKDKEGEKSGMDKLNEGKAKVEEGAGKIIGK